MGAVMICKNEPAETPYYIESMGVRIYSMEELAYFQENLLSQLNEALSGQQKQINMLEKRIAELETNVTMLIDASQEGPAITLPPHYMPERY